METTARLKKIVLLTLSALPKNAKGDLVSMTHNPLVIAASGSMVVLSWPHFSLAQSANRTYESLGDAQADITLADDSADILT
ncbi:MAG: hypothetical protein ACREVH_06225 [Gammaproteobacteria bacterium]